MNETLARIAELRAKATPGPWYAETERDGAILSTRVGSEGHGRGVGDYAFIYGPSKEPIASIASDVGQDQSFAPDDAEFIAAVGSLTPEDWRSLAELVRGG